MICLLLGHKVDPATVWSTYDAEANEHKLAPCARCSVVFEVVWVRYEKPEYERGQSYVVPGRVVEDPA